MHSLCCIAKDESIYLLEWLAHHRVIGFQDIVIYDNGSSPNDHALLTALAQAGFIRLVDWPSLEESPQASAYSHAARNASAQWLCFLDADEFLVLGGGHLNLPQFLAPFGAEDTAIAINWRVFGSNGHATYQPEPVTERFTRCAVQDFAVNRHVKTIARPHAIGRAGAHCSTMKYGRIVDDCGQPLVLQAESLSPTVSWRRAQVNHYHTKSRQEYRWKAARGRATVPTNHPEKHTKHDDELFAWHDRNEQLDEGALITAPATRGEIARIIHALGVHSAQQHARPVPPLRTSG